MFRTDPDHGRSCCRCATLAQVDVAILSVKACTDGARRLSLSDALPAGKGYDADVDHADLMRRNIEPVIPGRSNRRVKIEHDRLFYKQRNRIERMFGHLESIAPSPPATTN